MSAPASELAAAHPSPADRSQSQTPTLEKLHLISHEAAQAPVIAVDLDDVLAQTNRSVAEWHNEIYGTDMTVDDFLYYYYWKNKYWGSPKETAEKVADYYKSKRIFRTEVVPGAVEGTRALKDMGFRLLIVTARNPDQADESWKWVEEHFPGIFESIICTGQFKNATKNEHEVVTKLSKAEVCAGLKAKMLIDDSSENALQVVTATHLSHKIHVLLFGDYEWNKRTSSSDDAKPEMVYEERLKRENGHEFWKDEHLEDHLPPDASLTRVKSWEEVVAWVRAHPELLTRT
ncbi:5' nucleotidase [Schizophyllum commune]